VTLPDGLWKGQLKIKLIDALEKESTDSWEIVFSACKGEVKFWASDLEGGYTNLGKFTGSSLPDTHFFHVVRANEKQPGWVEIQTYSLVELDAERAVVAWTRAVNNRNLKEGAERYFLSRGTTQLTRVDNPCDSESD
jgi:hypothetical protein